MTWMGPLYVEGWQWREKSVWWIAQRRKMVKRMTQGHGWGKWLWVRNFRSYMLWMTPGWKLRVLNDMDDSGSEVKSFKCYGWLWVKEKKNNSGSWAQGSKWIADQDAFQLMVPSRGYSQVARMMKMKHLKDVKIWTTADRELKARDSMNDSRSWCNE